MADNPQKTKQFDDWRNQAFAERANREAARRRTELWHALSKFIHSQGAWLISTPGAKYLRIEILKNSPLPARLLEVGYSVRAAGSTTRIALGNFAPVDIISVTLGK